ncbi:MAG: hypothetical protein SFU98_00420 [Leptospiraceae bacterium]|nr:hypothetical protein [Leptospiraceae bacterium]
MEQRLFPISKREIILTNLDLFCLPPYVESRIEAILNGERLESSLVCCNSGCNVCSETIYNCLQKIKRELGNSVE